MHIYRVYTYNLQTPIDLALNYVLNKTNMHSPHQYCRTVATPAVKQRCVIWMISQSQTASGHRGTEWCEAASQWKTTQTLMSSQAQQPTHLPHHTIYWHLRLLLVLFVTSGSARTVKEPSHFEVRKSSSQVTGCTFSSKIADDLFSYCPQNTGMQNANAVSQSK